jgi:hypothetical protein
LLFADDCSIFSEASEISVQRLANILENYNKGSGQLVNKDKSAILFSGNTLENLKTTIHDILGIQRAALGEKYLGLPTAVGHSTNGAFDFVRERIRNLVNGSGENLLNCTACEVLIKAVAQAMPTYSMSCFKFPPALCLKFTSYISNYWWGSSLDNHKIHWVRWSHLTKQKGKSGMGFRDLRFFNQALLGKQGWRLLTKPNIVQQSIEREILPKLALYLYNKKEKKYYNLESNIAWP